MAFTLKRKIYQGLPLWLQRSVQLVPFAWLAGRAYREAFRRGPFFERATREQIRAYQTEALGRMLRFAVDQVPAYAPQRGSVERHAPFDALREFPPIDKDELQQDLERYLPRDLPSIPHFEISTGGTSGNQLKVLVEDASQAIEHAFVHRLWARVGYTPRHRKATFRGVEFRALPAGVYWQHNPINNELQFSPFLMNDETLPAYVDALVEFAAPYIHGYPSAVDLLASFVLREGLQERLPPIRAICLVSEACAADQRERIERAFRTRVFSFYGHSERLVMAGECEKNDTYHCFPDYGIAEILREDGSPCAPDEPGEIVGTGLLNRAMPLIRYRTGDFARPEPSECECGRKWDRFSHTEGRWKQEMIVGRNGSRISLTALNMHGPVFDRVARYQYVQSEAGTCELRVMVAPGFGESDLRAIEEAYAGKLAGEVGLSVVVVENIELTERGKLRRLVSTLPQGSGSEDAA